MRVPHPIPYQGSKRHIAKFILPFFPKKIGTLVEPFAGSAAMSIAAAHRRKAARFYLNDINAPLMTLWEEIINNPENTANSYEKLWNEQRGREREFYDFIRDEFNKTKKPNCLLYLLARCVKASVRYNSKGEFNQSPDNRRRGRNPQQMREDILAVSKLLRGRTVITSEDYRDMLKSVGRNDLVYMDPPYQGVCRSGDPRYYNSIDFEELIRTLETLINREITFILSYDGRTGKKTYGKELPPELGLHRVEIKAGRSAQSTLLGGKAITYESIYLSPGLIHRLNISSDKLANHPTLQKRVQLKLQFATD